MDKLPAKEVKLFEAVRNPEFENFVLSATENDHIVICADHGEEGDEDDEASLEILYVRATPEVLEALEIMPAEEIEGRVISSRPAKRWKG